VKKQRIPITSASLICHNVIFLLSYSTTYITYHRALSMVAPLCDQRMNEKQIAGLYRREVTETQGRKRCFSRLSQKFKGYFSQISLGTFSNFQNSHKSRGRKSLYHTLYPNIHWISFKLFQNVIDSLLKQQRGLGSRSHASVVPLMGILVQSIILTMPPCLGR
jgi:hypothetical protein